MKNIIFIVTFLLGVNNLVQADMLGSKKDSVACIVDSTEVEIMHFSDAEIMKIIKESKIYNPQIKNLSIIKTTDTIVLRINDSLAYSFSPLRGGSCWKQLSKGINKADLFSIPLILYQEIQAERSAVSVPKKSEGLSKAIVFDNRKIDNEDVSFSDSSFRKSDTLSDYLPAKNDGYFYNYNGNETTKIKFGEIFVGIIFILIMIFASIRGWEDYKKNRPYNHRRYLREERRRLQKVKREREHFLK